MSSLNQLQLKALSPLTTFLTTASLLLLVLFTAGCSEQSPSALSPSDESKSTDVQTFTDSEQNQSGSPMLAKTAGASEATFRVTLFGDVTGGLETRTYKTQPSSTQVVLNDGIDVELAYLQTAIAGGGICFSAGSYRGPMIISAVSKKNPSLAQCTFWFQATGSDGVTEIRYVLTMNGTFTDPDNWPSAVGTQNTVILTDWETKTNGKGQNRKVSCTGNGSFSSGVTVLVERIS